MTHITKLKSPMGKKTTVIMNKFIFSLLAILAFSNIGKSQGTSLDDINGTRLMYDMSTITQAEYDFIIDAGLVEIYRTTIGDIGIFQVLEYPVYVDNLPLHNIIQVNNGVRPGSSDSNNAQEGATDTDNYDYKSYLPDPDSGGSSTSSDPFACTNYNYLLSPKRSKVSVAIFDSGINNNFEVQGYNPNVIVENTLLGDITNDNEAIDDNNHGTHLAHIIQTISGSVNSNFIEYLDYKIVNDEGQGYMVDLIMAADKAVAEHGANILNISLSSVQGDKNFFLGKFFNALVDENVLVITSAGNNAEILETSNGLSINSSPVNFLNVGSINCSNNISQFSNTGSMVNVYVSGEDINSYDKNGNFHYYSGTSQATALLSGMAAALATYQDQFDAAELKCAILSSLDGQNVGENTPTVDLDEALQNLPNGCTAQSGDKNNSANSEINTLNSNLSQQEIYPNPASDNITITLYKGNYTILINNLLGKNIVTKHIAAYSKHHKERIDLPNSTQKGFHSLIIINNDTQEVSTQKLMVARE